MLALHKKYKCVIFYVRPTWHCSMYRQIYNECKWKFPAIASTPIVLIAILNYWIFLNAELKLFQFTSICCYTLFAVRNKPLFSKILLSFWKELYFKLTVIPIKMHPNGSLWKGTSEPVLVRSQLRTEYSSSFGWYAREEYSHISQCSGGEWWWWFLFL